MTTPSGPPGAGRAPAGVPGPRPEWLDPAAYPFAPHVLDLPVGAPRTAGA